MSTVSRCDECICYQWKAAKIPGQPSTTKSWKSSKWVWLLNHISKSEICIASFRRMYSGWCSFTGGEIKRIKPIATNIIDGGVWKGASYIKNSGSRKTRSGTYDADRE